CARDDYGYGFDYW
nr:immunoglobulin heavy chain junction region [Macaca mulatta]